MNRRLFLRSAAATLWLPFLASAPGMAAQAQPVRRKVWVFVPNGFLPAALTPATAGAGYVMPAALAPLEAIRDRATILTGLRNYADRNGERFGFSTHEVCTASLLSDHVQDENYYSSGARNATTVDQVAVAALRPPTPYGSLQLGTGERYIPPGGTLDVLYNHLSWANDVTPLAPLVDPRTVFDNMFGGSDSEATAEEQERRAALRKSVLDAVNDRASALSRKLDAGDRQKLDQYTTSVRELELRLDALAKVECEPGAAPGEDLGFAERLEAMFGILRVALTCDVTRMATFMTATTTALTTFSWLGITTDHHSLSHAWPTSDPMRADYVAIQTFYVERFVAFCQSLAAIPDGDGDLLSNTLVTLMSEFGDSNAHVASPTVMFAAGGDGGGLVHGRHLANDDVPHSNYLRATLDFLGVDPTGFGTTATGTLDLR